MAILQHKTVNNPYATSATIQTEYIDELIAKITIKASQTSSRKLHCSIPYRNNSASLSTVCDFAETAVSTAFSTLVSAT